MNTPLFFLTVGVLLGLVLAALASKLARLQAERFRARAQAEDSYPTLDARFHQWRKNHG